jgi:ABC-type transport system involved in multi-copper enzyme maturation permease subunit
VTSWGGISIVVRYTLEEALRRRVFVVVALLTALFLGLYGLGVRKAYEEAADFASPDTPLELDPETLAGATVFGLALFATLFLGTVLAVFLTLGAVRGDAERGLLQPLVVRPLGRPALLVARFVGAAAVCTLYVAAVYAAAVALTWTAGPWRPDRLVLPAAELAAAVALVAALALLGSVFLASTANGIAIFMAFGAGLTAGLLGQVGEAIGSPTLERIARVAAWVFPFEALYQDALDATTRDTAGFTGFALSLGPFGGAQHGGVWLAVWSACYLAAVAVLALVGFARRDL